MAVCSVTVAITTYDYNEMCNDNIQTAIPTNKLRRRRIHELYMRTRYISCTI